MFEGGLDVLAVYEGAEAEKDFAGGSEAGTGGADDVGLIQEFAGELPAAGLPPSIMP